MRRALPLFCAVALAALIMPAVYATQTSSHDTSSSKPGKQHPQAQQGTAPPVNEGERIFQRNCSRCHTAPDGFSPRISGTIVRHMRIRANLSQHDEQELLRFFNP